MNDSISRDQKPDPEMAAVIARFEQAYAELEPDAQPEPERANAAADSMLPQSDYEFPAEPDAPALDELDMADDADQSQDRAAVEMRESSDAGGDAPDDVESAFAILRAGERRASARTEAPQHESPRAMRDAHALSKSSEVRSKSFRRFAVPGAAVAIFAGLLGGYLMTRHGEIPSSAAIVSDAPAGIAASQLRLDYDLTKSSRRDTVAQSRNR